LGQATASLIFFFLPPDWLNGWYRLVPLAPAAFGTLLAIRFTRDDRNVAGRIAGLEIACVDYERELQKAELLLEAKDDLISDHVETVEFLRDLLNKPSETLTITDRNGNRIVPKHERDDTWRRAMVIVRSAQEDFGKFRGHDVLGHTQDEQTAALKMLKHLGVAASKGTIWRLTVSRQKAIDLLNAFAVEANANPSPAPEKPDAHPDDSASRQEVESGLGSGWVTAGEGLASG
jgi:hypothetical protein